MPPSPVRQPSSLQAELIERLLHSGQLEDCQVLSPAQGGTWWAVRGVIAGLSGRLTLADHELRLRVGLTPHFPHCLPEIAVESIHPPVELPHVLSDSKLCFEPDGGLILDSRAPWDVLLEALMLARARLHDMLTGDRAKEFLREAGVYWRGMAGSARVPCAVTPGEHPRSVTALMKQGSLYALVDDPSGQSHAMAWQHTPGLTYRNAIYLPLDPLAVDSGFTPKRLRTLDGLRSYTQALPENDRRALSKLFARISKDETLLVLGLRRPEGERVLLGARLVGMEGDHPLVDEQAQGRIEPLELERMDQAFLAPRGGAGRDLKERRVLLVGCGSVGGHIAMALARAGVGQLTLLDPDVFELANAYRHVCGKAWKGQNKAFGLAAELMRLLPHFVAQPLPLSIQILMEDPAMMQEHDLVIAATGDPTVELQLNEWLWSDARHPPALFTWVEPLGLGGHVLLSHPRPAGDPRRGCLECLYRRPIESGPIENRAAFARPGVVYTRDILGCGSRYLPFADLDAQRTAELAARLALRVLRKEAGDSLLLSWKGDSRAFEEAGYHVTPRYALDQRQLDAGSQDHARPDCPVCGR